MAQVSPQRVCLFAHFDPRHRIRPHVLHYLSALRACGFNVVVACSGNRLPPVGDREAAYEAGATLYFRGNAGYDFGAWRDLIREGFADNAEAVLLANDSVFGPFADLTPIVSRMCVTRADVWGMIESLQSGWHLQSWFLHFSAAAFAAPAIRRVFDQPFEQMTKQDVIQSGELALGTAMRKESLSCDAVVRHAEGSWMARLRPTNPMHINWRHLLISGRLPFIKADLLRDNLMNIPWISQWADVLRDRYGVPTAPISDYLFDYKGIAPEWPGQPFPTPVRNARLRVLLEYALVSRDHGPALRALAARLTSDVMTAISRLQHQRPAGDATARRAHIKH
jgi:lipopolysaccharide biosynthesis protein